MSHKDALTYNRRNFLKITGMAGTVLAGSFLIDKISLFGGTPAQAAGTAIPAYEIPGLSYSENALEPYISAKTISFHYGKHTQAYFDAVNKLLAEKPMPKLSLKELVAEASKNAADVSLFNNAAQAWNHVFYWQCLTPAKEEQAPTKVVESITASFGNFESFKKEFLTAGVSQFGSGWVWLVKDGDKLKVLNTPNAMTPITSSQIPLLVLDVWEHAYYLDYQNRRADYLEAVFDNLINWNFVAENLG